MSISEAFFLGLLQGITEFLPISSSGHLVIANKFLGINTEQNLLIVLLFHLATALSIIAVFYKEIGKMLQSLFFFRWDENTKNIVKLLLSAIPIFIVGFFFKENLEIFFAGNILLVAVMLSITAILLFLSYKKKEQKKDISYLRGFLIGIFQTLAILPGLSRSGVTITIGILLGCDRKKITKFSFLMLLAPVLGASFLEAVSLTKKTLTIPISSLLVGFLTAFFVGYFCCLWMRILVQKNQLVYFALYCILLAGVLFLL